MNESAPTLARLQQIIDASIRSAGPAMRRNFASEAWSMSASEFVEFWGEARMCSVSTASLGGLVHAVPLDIHLVDGVFYIPTFPDSRRLRDHRENPRCVITSWNDPYRAVIVIGIASESRRDPTGRTAETGQEQGYAANAMLTVEVRPTRIYAIRPPEGHHANS